jgi:hypothetical protein
LIKLFQRGIFCGAFVIDYCTFCAGLGTFGLPSAEVADKNDFIEYLYCSDGTGFLTDSARCATGGGDNDLTLTPEIHGIFRAAHAVMFFTLNTKDRSIRPGFVEIHNFDAGEVVVDPSCVEKSTGCFTPAAPCALADIGLDHLLLLAVETSFCEILGNDSILMVILD